MKMQFVELWTIVMSTMLFLNVNGNSMSLRGAKVNIGDSQTVIENMENIEEYLRAIVLGGGELEYFNNRPWMVTLYALTIQPSKLESYSSWNAEDLFKSSDKSKKLVPSGYKAYDSTMFTKCTTYAKENVHAVVRNGVVDGPATDGELRAIHESVVRYENPTSEKQTHTHIFSETVSTTRSATVVRGFGLEIPLPIPSSKITLSSSSTETQTELVQQTVTENVPIVMPPRTCYEASLTVMGQERIQNYNFPTYLQGAVVSAFGLASATGETKFKIKQSGIEEYNVCYWYKPSSASGDLVNLKAHSTYEKTYVTVKLREYQYKPDGSLECDYTNSVRDLPTIILG